MKCKQHLLIFLFFISLNCYCQENNDIVSLTKITFLDPKNSILNYPNKITDKDFTHWTQEQGLYYPSEWDKAFTPILSSHDQGETDKNGALLVAKYGKGFYIYTGLSFFRELPEGVPGAFRLMANMISVK